MAFLENGFKVVVLLCLASVAKFMQDLMVPERKLHMWLPSAAY
jgi:hypothetical protein